jgi:hypothetical protein
MTHCRDLSVAVKVFSKCPSLLELAFLRYSCRRQICFEKIAGALLKITSASMQLLQVESLEQTA